MDNFDKLTYRLELFLNGKDSNHKFDAGSLRRQLVKAFNSASTKRTPERCALYSKLMKSLTKGGR